MTISTTNILALPPASATITVSNNEDWIDSILYFVDTGIGDPTANQLDLRGIRFEMEIRRAAEDTEVVLHASTDDSSLALGFPPDYGYLIINISHKAMAALQAGVYVGDIVASDAIYERRCLAIDLTVVQGITR
jgi:hypothetical protein